MVIKLGEDIRPITDLRMEFDAVFEKLKKTKRPIVLTKRGRVAAILEDVEHYEEREERMQLLEAIVRGIEAAEKGEIVSQREAMKRLHQLIHG